LRLSQWFFFSQQRFYLVGANLDDTCYRVLKIDRTSGHELNFTEDETVYDHRQMVKLLEMVNEGNKSTGGLKKVATADGLLGFMRFLEGYYMVLVTSKSHVASIGGHAVFHIDDYVVLPIAQKSDSLKHPDEQK